MGTTARRMIQLALVLLFMAPCCLAQSGYDYARPEIATPTAASANSIRPIIPIGNAGPSAATAAAPTYSSAATAYGGPTNINAATAAAGAPFGAYNPATAAAAFTGGTAAGLSKRPVLSQRSGPGGIYAGGNIGAGQAQFGSAVRGNAATTGPDADYDGDYSAIPGVPAVDYPVYAQVPPTNFDCAQQLPGYYADVEAQCQVFHICALNRTYSFLCPNGTVFSQETLVCVWWNQFDCGTAPSLYANNAYIYDYNREGAASGGAQIGIGAAAGRTPANYAGAVASSGARSGPAALQTAGIYGAGNLRSTAYSAVPTAVTGLSAANFGGSNVGDNSAIGRFMSASTPATQTFNAGTSVGTPVPFGSAVVRAAGAGSGGGGGGGGGTYSNAQISATSKNREYLPPRRT